MMTIETSKDSKAGILKRFFFDRDIPVGMALMRISLPCVLLVDTVRRWPHVREIYSMDGAPGPLADNFGYPHFLPEFSAPVAVALYTILAFLLFTSAIGWCTRFSLAVTTVLYVYFGLMDCMGTITKYTVISTHLLLLLSLSNCGALWSVDGWLKRRRDGEAAWEASLVAPVWPQRLVQLLLGFIYFGAAITKIHTPAFFSGDQLMYWMMTYINNQHPLGDILAQYPIVLSVFGYITIVWEMVFIFTVFQKRMKWWALAVGAIFHIMTSFGLGLIIFPLVMLSSYLVFVTDQELRGWLASSLFRRWSGSWISLPSAANTAVQSASEIVSWQPRLAGAALFGIVLVTITLGGVAAEQKLDPYHMSGPNGPLPLRELPQEEIQRLFSTDMPLKQVDKLQAFDLGTIVVGEHLLDRRREFKQNERFFAQMTLSPPHEDLWVDCILNEATKETDADGNVETVPGKLITKIGQIVPREVFRSNFIFKLDESCDPGEYFLRLRTGNEEIARRKFTLVGKPSAPAAN